MPTAIFGGHNLNRLAPVGDSGRRRFRLAPPQPGWLTGGCLTKYHTRKDSLVALLRLDHTEVEDLFIGAEKDFVPAPTGASVGTLRITVYDVVLLVRPGDVPHLPL